MNAVYGPIASRRLGQSLGIDPVPLKTCNWNCIYCQLGRTQPLLRERKEYIPAETILAELQRALADHTPGAIDWVTFAGSGEPTLHSQIGWLIQQAQMQAERPVADHPAEILARGRQYPLERPGLQRSDARRAPVTGARCRLAARYHNRPPGRLDSSDASVRPPDQNPRSRLWSWAVRQPAGPAGPYVCGGRLQPGLFVVMARKPAPEEASTA
jgi:hypothetical protein